MGLKRIVPFIVVFVVLACISATTAAAQSKRKVIIDQDARGAATTDQQSILMFLQSPNVETLGITGFRRAGLHLRHHSRRAIKTKSDH